MCKHLHKKCHWKSYHDGIKYRMELYAIFSIMILSKINLLCKYTYDQLGTLLLLRVLVQIHVMDALEYKYIRCVLIINVKTHELPLISPWHKKLVYKARFKPKVSNIYL